MPESKRPPATERLERLATQVAEEFAATRRLLSFDEWFELLLESPKLHARNSAQYVRDALEYFGREDVRTPQGPAKRFRLFDREFDDGPRLVGQERAQTDLYEVLDGFCRLGRIDSLILLHGPNGSAKSTLLECLQAGLEAYSHTEDGLLYRFAWVFPTRRVAGGGIGFGSAPLLDALGEETFARLESDDIEARLIDENKDHPLFLIPLAARQELLAELFADDEDFVVPWTIRNGELSARNRKIFDALLTAYQGDLAEVYKHVQVERLYLSRTYRTGLVDVEPKQTVDARSFPVTGDRAFAHLPASVAGQVLYGTQGDLVDAQRGVLNFSDLLKRPYEHYKYLLTATESARVVLDHLLLGLDTVFTGSANDINLLEFRALRSAEYQSFRARLDLIPVPYLLDYRVERKIYQEQVGDMLRGVHIAPHVPRILALWGVMTRLRRPDASKYSEKLRKVLDKLTPLQKADLYAYGRIPEGLSSEEARELLAAVPQMYTERYDHAVVRVEGSDYPLGDYEGSFGASVRDLKNVLMAAASDLPTNARCVTVPRVFDELRVYLADRINHRWMHLEANAGFHQLDGANSITELAFERWLSLSDWEVREALGLVDEARYLELFRKYVFHASHHVKGERIFDEVTGQLLDPDEKFMAELERAMDPNPGAGFRKDLLGRIGAWALSHPNEEPNYEAIFPDYFGRMREEYYRQQKDTVRKGIQYMLELLTEDRPSEFDLSQAERDKAKLAVEVLLGEHDVAGTNERRDRHTHDSLKETLVQLSKHRY
ncbi:serine protein kinase PrkA [Pseudenhygromyxa sp. WMMC2535]|uniref:serine protein kinase PrkA n=1 Tax=Pseudenhygromyxa sp. WMMC2535 TaxID=2712867 RepID=UPI0015577278|nr:serine protein kinase PrkA [Pseudenhygromyxa sp. WMMC2535]NVB42263.1 serine protein kinase PrkA [Pseudenhygromyxa sp. WMMC2535]